MFHAELGYVIFHFLKSRFHTFSMLTTLNKQVTNVKNSITFDDFIHNKNKWTVTFFGKNTSISFRVTIDVSAVFAIM